MTPRNADAMAADVHAHSTFARGPVAADVSSPVTSAATAGPTDSVLNLGGEHGQPAPGVTSLSPSLPAAGRCPVTVYVTPRGPLDERLYQPRTCRKRVVADGLCRKHLADRDRLGGAS